VERQREPRQARRLPVLTWKASIVALSRSSDRIRSYRELWFQLKLWINVA
jgi:hypothetical protein